MNEQHAKQEAEAQMQMAKAISQQAAVIVINNREDYLAAGETLKVLKARWKAVEDKRTSLTKPLNDVLRNINGMFMPVLGEWDAIMARVKLAMQAFDKQEADRQREALEAAAQLAQQGQTGQEFVALVQQGSAVPQQVKGISKRIIKRWRIVDASALPREYLTPDIAKLDAAAKAGVAPPGVELYDEEIMSVRAG